jgi:hypothetical protein
MFNTWEVFRQWYLRMKLTFINLTVRWHRIVPGINSNVYVGITY